MNTIVYCIPARWIWGPTGFLSEAGVIDIAGSGAVHLLGGISGEGLSPRTIEHTNKDTNLKLKKESLHWLFV